MSSMIAALFLLLLALPIVELWVIVKVAGAFGVLNTLVVLFLVSALGAWLLKRQGMSTWRRLRRALESGRMPAEEASDGALILLGGAFLLTPGFVTDAAGLLLLFPPARAVMKRTSRRFLARWVKRRAGSQRRARIYSTRVVNEPPRDGPGVTRQPDALPPRTTHESDSP